MVLTACVRALLPLALAGTALSMLPARQGGPAMAPAQGIVRGRVDVGGPLAAADRRPTVTSLDAEGYRPPARRRAVVYFETAPQGAFEGIVDLHVTMKQENETFVPHVVAVRVGGVVHFPNADPFFHNVFSLSKPRRFDLGRYGKGRSKAVRFDEPGVVRVFCDIHSHMSAFILVFAHRFFAVTDDQGRYRIEGVPAGTYTVTAWYEGVAQASRSVTMPEAGGTVDADFTLRGH